MLMSPFLLYPNYCLPGPEDCNTCAGPAATLINQITCVMHFVFLCPA